MSDINLMAPINPLGYGVVGTNILASLCELGHNVSLFCIGQPQTATPYVAYRVKESIGRSEFFNVDAPCVKIWHQHDMAQRVGKKIYGFPIFELDSFTKTEIHHLNSVDHLLVPSAWAANILTECNDIDTIPTDVIPLGVDNQIFHPIFINKDNNKCIFLNVGKWETRKGHDILSTAFNDAFNYDDDVELWMLCNNPFYTPEENKWWANKYLNSRLGNKIKILDAVSTQEEVANIMRQATCGVFPARGEGFNLEILEMMACGKPVIVTNYSGHTEFCNKDNSMLIEIEELEPAIGIQKDKQWFHGQGNWAKLGHNQHQQLVEYMQQVHKQHDNIVNNSGIETANKFSWINSAQKLINVIER